MRALCDRLWPMQSHHMINKTNLTTRWGMLSDTTTTHYSDVIMGAMRSQITGVSIIYSTVGSGADQRKHQRSASLAFVGGIHRWPMNSPHKGPVTREMFPLDDFIMSFDERHASSIQVANITTSSHGNSLRITVLLFRKPMITNGFSLHRTSDVQLFRFLCC